MFRRNAAHLCQSDWHVSIDETSDHRSIEDIRKQTVVGMLMISATLLPPMSHLLSSFLFIPHLLNNSINVLIGILEKCGPGFPLYLE